MGYQRYGSVTIRVTSTNSGCRIGTRSLLDGPSIRNSSEEMAGEARPHTVFDMDVRIQTSTVSSRQILQSQNSQLDSLPTHP